MSEFDGSATVSMRTAPVSYSLGSDLISIEFSVTCISILLQGEVGRSNPINSISRSALVVVASPGRIL